MGQGGRGKVSPNVRGFSVKIVPLFPAPKMILSLHRRRPGRERPTSNQDGTFDITAPFPRGH